MSTASRVYSELLRRGLVIGEVGRGTFVSGDARHGVTVPAEPPTSEGQPGRPRAGSKKNAKGRRSSVPSWDEIMLGSSRQRE